VTIIIGSITIEKLFRVSNGVPVKQHITLDIIIKIMILIETTLISLYIDEEIDKMLSRRTGQNVFGCGRRLLQVMFSQEDGGEN
jgi:hypothetical protein